MYGDHQELNPLVDGNHIFLFWMMATVTALFYFKNRRVTPPEESKYTSPNYIGTSENGRNGGESTMGRN